MYRAFIDGQAGTTGLQIQKRLEAHPAIELIPIREEDRKNPEARHECMARADVVFLCLPDNAAIESAALAADTGCVVIDASTAHRTNPEWAYGLPELAPSFREAVKKGKRIANPGCHATGFLTAAYPLLAAGVISPEYPFFCQSLTGYSGGGKKMIAEYEAAERSWRLDSPRIYGLSQEHKHLPEMQKIAGLKTPPVFQPIVCDFYSGMATSIALVPDRMEKLLSLSQVFALYAAHYAGEELIEVALAPEGGFVAANELRDSNRLRILVMGNEERITITSLFDNLGKGASGAAVQNMNLALGLPETQTLL